LAARSKRSAYRPNALHRSCAEFIKAKDCSGNVKNGQYISDFVCEHVESLPEPRNVVAVLMDNATRSAWPIIEKRCPWIVCAPCMPHVLDLLLEDIGKMATVASVFERGAALRKFVRNHQHVLAAFRDVSEGELSNPGATRFKTVLIGLLSLIKHRDAVTQAMVSTEVAKAVKAAQAPTPALYAAAKATAMSDTFWEEADMVVAIMEPIARLLTFCDSDAPTMSKVHYSMFLVQEAIEALSTPADMKAEILALLRARWDYGFSPLQGAAYVLDPEFWDCPSDPETKAAFRAMVDKTYAYPPELDDDASPEDLAAREAVRAELRGKRAAAERQLRIYKDRIDVFARDITIENARHMSAADWWAEYGEEVPELQLVATRCCGCVSGAGAAERGHKEMAFLLTKIRNRMQWPKTEKMLYVRINENMMRKRQRIGFRVAVADASTMEADEDDEQPAMPSAWREAEEEAEAEFAAEADTHTTRGAARAQRVAAGKPHRRKPAAAEPEAEPAAEAQATRGGRVVRQRAVFDL
jgi:hypothetical protein